MAKWMCLYFVLMVCWNSGKVYLHQEDPSGYTDFFQSNLKEFNDEPLKFDNPVPTWLKGTLIRNGAGRFEMGSRKFKHTFDAFGKLHAFKFYGNGSASMSAKFIYSDYYKKSLSDNTIYPYLQFDLVDPPFHGIEILEAFSRSMDNTNINVNRILNPRTNKYEYFALNDIWKVYQIDHNDLQTISQIVPEANISSLVYAHVTSSSHPVKEYGKENLITFLMSLSKIPDVSSNIRLFRMNSALDREEIVKWDIEANRYIHSFSLTENYAVLIAPPIFIDTLKLFEHADVYDSMNFDEKSDTLIYLVNLKMKKVSILKSESSFMMHHINAYEENGDIIVDVCAFDNASNVEMLELNHLRDPLTRNDIQFRNYLKRYVINKRNFKVETFIPTPSLKVPYSTIMDMPTINENFRSKKYCYTYGVGMKIDNKNLNSYAIVKKDLCQNNDLSWAMKNHYPSEAYFVPTPGAFLEDDGILLTHVFNGTSKQSYLLLLDATTMKPVSQSVLPTFVPMSFHGRFFDNISIK